MDGGGGGEGGSSMQRRRKVVRSVTMDGRKEFYLGRQHSARKGVRRRRLSGTQWDA